MVQQAPPKNMFITGKPGCGKTALLREVCLQHMDCIGGYYTEEIWDGPSRAGFTLKTFDGRSGVLAKKGMESPHKLNKYGIDLGVLENIGVDSIKKALTGKKVVVIDEIGTMEVFSDAFRQALVEILHSPIRVLATIRYKSQPYTNDVKKMPATSLVYLSRDNYLEVKTEIKLWLRSACSAPSEE
jgi:nucleoside-triphosphatase